MLHASRKLYSSGTCVLGHRSCFDRASLVWIYVALMLTEISNVGWMDVTSDSGTSYILVNMMILIEWLCL